MATRKERLEEAEAYLKAATEKYGSIPIYEYVSLLVRKMGITRELASDYWNVLKSNGKFDNNGFAAYPRGKKPKELG